MLNKAETKKFQASIFSFAAENNGELKLLYCLPFIKAHQPITKTEVMNKTNSIERKFDGYLHAVLSGIQKAFKAAFTSASFWLLLAIIMLGLNYVPNKLMDPFSAGTYYKGINKKLKKAKTEEFSNEIAAKFSSVDDIVYYLSANGDTTDKFETLERAAFLLRHRFYHAYSIYSFEENWMAVLAGRFIWRDLSAKVIADDILKGNVAACSQVSIVFMNLCNKLGVPVRKVALSGHYTIEAMVQKKWYFFDIDLKPDFKSINGRKSLEEVLKNKEQFALYENTILDTANIKRVFSKVQYGVPNLPPAPRAFIFHYITKFLSHYGWIIPFYLFIFTLYKKGISIKIQSFHYKPSIRL